MTGESTISAASRKYDEIHREKARHDIKALEGRTRIFADTDVTLKTLSEKLENCPIPDKFLSEVYICSMIESDDV